MDFAFNLAFSLKVSPLSVTSGISGKSDNPKTFIDCACWLSRRSNSTIFPLFFVASTSWRIVCEGYLAKAAICNLVSWAQPAAPKSSN